MNIVLLVYVVFLLNGAPVPGYMVFPEGHPCGYEQAKMAARNHMEATDTPVQEYLLWNCFPIESPGTGPAMKPALLEGQTEAAHLQRARRLSERVFTR